MRERVREGERWVRLITGRGVHSRGRPVLREEIDDLLRGLAGSLVRRVEVESGGGAFRVELKSPEIPPAPRHSALLAASPELRRLAEEALAELGVTPTPELLAAEIRRLREERRAAPPPPHP